jgi:hypothetical protein
MLRIPKRQESKERIIPTHIVIEKSASKEKKTSWSRENFFLPYIYKYIYLFFIFLYIIKKKTPPPPPTQGVTPAKHGPISPLKNKNNSCPFDSAAQPFPGSIKKLMHRNVIFMLLK